MGSKTRLSSYCTKRANNGVNLVTSRNINTRLARPITTYDDHVGLLKIILLNSTSLKNSSGLYSMNMCISIHRYTQG